MLNCINPDQVNSQDLLENLIALIAVLMALLGLVAVLITALASNNKTSRRKHERDTFDETIKGLCSNNDEQQISSAILLRRYLNRANYAGKQLEKYKRETLNVISAMLKKEKCCVLQKTLADSLSYVLSADDYDFQETNFQNACIKPNNECLIEDSQYESINSSLSYLLYCLTNFRILRYTKWCAIKNSNNKKPIRLSIKKADFYASDFSYASVNFVDAQEAVFSTSSFFQTTFRNCILDGAKFESANFKNARFFNCSIKNAKFDKAFMSGSTFTECEINGASFSNTKGRPNFISCSGTESTESSEEKRRKIFISRPGSISASKEDLLNHISSFLSDKEITPVSIDTDHYRERGQLSEITKEISQCIGCVSFGFQDLNVHQGTYREGTPQFETVIDKSYVSPWINIEIGIASGLGLPIFMLQDSNLSGGMYDDNISDHHITRVKLDDLEISDLDRSLEKWVLSII